MPYPVTTGLPRIAYPVGTASVNFTASPRLLGRYDAGPGPGQEIELGIFSIDDGTLHVDAAAQYNVLGRQTAGAGAYEDSTREQLLLAGTDLPNVFTADQSIIRDGSNAVLSVVSSGSSPVVDVTRYATAGPGTGAAFRGFRAGGTLAAPTAVANGDVLCSLQGRGYGGSIFVLAGQFNFAVIEPVPSDTAMGARFNVVLCQIGSAAASAVFSCEHAAGLLFRNNVFLNGDRLLTRRPFTFGTLPAAAVSTDGFATITDGAAAPVWNAAAAGGAAVRTPVWSNGAAWLNG
jgi:hypothetical protein